MSETQLPDLHATSSALRELHAVPRVPSAELRAAPVHVAVGTFAQPRTDLASGREVGWAIVVAPEEGGARISVGRTVSAAPAALIVAELERMLGTVHEAVWVSVPKQRRGLAATLRRAGFDVTAGLGMGSRAEPELREQMARQSQLLLLTARRSGVVPSNRTKTAERPDPSTPVLWLPAEWRVAEQREVPVLHIAADASLECAAYSRLFSACAVSDRGDCVVNSAFTQGHIGEVELIAIVQALEMIAVSAPLRAVVSSDSMQAIEAVRWLTDGARSDSTLPGGRWVDEAARTRFLDAWRRAQARTQVSFRHVLGHAGDPLNEAADSIARTARRAAAAPLPEGGRALYQHLDAFLAAVGESSAARGTEAGGAPLNEVPLAMPQPALAPV